MPLADARPGPIYSACCVDGSGRLIPYEGVLGGTIRGYFMRVEKMKCPDAEAAARKRLAKMPAWSVKGAESSTS